MRIFLTGASGFIGSAVIPELLGAGHEVLGLARSDASAQAVADAGATVHRGSLDDLDSLRAGAQEADGVIHLAFHHDFSDMAGAAVLDRGAIDAFGDVLAGSGRPLVIASGVLGLTPGEVATEEDAADASVHPRIANAAATLALAERGVRSSVVRLAPTVHGEGDHGFIAALIGIARSSGTSGYVGDGENHWPAVHVRDAASLFRLAAESAPAGAVLHGVAEQGVRIRDVADVVGRHLDIPVASIAPEDADAHFGWLGRFLALDAQASNAITRELLGWDPARPTLLEDLGQGHYFAGV